MEPFLRGGGPEFLWPDIDILRLDIHILRPNINILRPDIRILRPGNDILRQFIDILRPDTDILRPDIDIFSKKHDLARLCFQLWPKIGHEGDKISREKNWRGASRDSFFSKFCHPRSQF